MTRTVLESKTKTVVIGFDEPFCVIGERINPTGRKKLAAELEAGNFETVIKDALEQVACGATCWTSTRARSSPTRWRRTRAMPTTTLSSRR
jgi:cobalamin-dependent methionine synthase I